MSQKSILIQYNTSVLNLPGKVAGVLDRASFEDLKVLITLADNPDLCQSFGEEDFALRVSEMSLCSPEDVTASLAFWRGAGILTLGTPAKKSSTTQAKSTPKQTPKPVAEEVAPKGSETVEDTQKKQVLARANELPQYTSEELASLLEARKETQALINDCQNIWGKMFNTQEVNIILGLVDFLELDTDYVIALLAYFKTSKVPTGTKASLRNVEKFALSLYDRGIQTVESLNHEIARVEQMGQYETQLRQLFGMGGRALTPTEKKHFSTWLYDFGYGMDVIRKAYDVTVDAKGSPNMKYMNSVLANWHKDGLKTPEEVDAAAERRRAQNNPQAKPAQNIPTRVDGTFDTDDFFSAAVRRNFGEDFDENA